MFLNNRRIAIAHSKYFDMWRGGAALVVAVGHAAEIFPSSFSPAFGKLFSALAGAAVMAFFAISGFFIHKSLSRCYNGTLNWRSFLKSRADRLLPPFAACIALTVIFWFLAPYFFASNSHEFITPSARNGYWLTGLWQTTLFVNNFIGPALSANGPLWSLAYEVWYYVLACLFVMAFTGRKIGWVALPLLILLTVLDKWFAILGVVWLGGFFVSVFHGADKLPKLPRIPMWIVPTVLLAAVMLVPDSMTGKASVLFRLIFGAWMIWHLIFILGREIAPEIRTLVWSASFSYSLYVFHFPILLFTYGISESAAFLALAIAILVSALVGPALERIRIPTNINFTFSRGL